MKHEVGRADRTLRAVLWWATLVAGCATSAPPVATRPDDASSVASDELGAETYRTICLPCHGADGRGGQGGGVSLADARDPRIISETVIYGQNNMPPFAGALTDEQIAAVSAYVVEHLAGD